MAGMLIRLQKELFVGDEQLLTMAHCFKLTNEKKGQSKRKEIYLCILNTQESNTYQPVGHFNISICEVTPHLSTASVYNCAGSYLIGLLIQFLFSHVIFLSLYFLPGLHAYHTTTSHSSRPLLIDDVA